MAELIYLALIIIFTIYFYLKDRNKLNSAAKFSKKMILGLTPYVIAILLVASIINTYVSKELIASVLGKNNGILAPIIAALCGAIFEGPTVVAFVLGASLLFSGASISAVGAFISSFSMVGLVAISLEKKELGIVFAATRFLVTLITSVFIGYVMGVFI